MVRTMPVIDMKKTGENIKAMRKANNISVKDIVMNTGVSERAVFKWQQGKSVPTVDNLVVLAVMFNVTMDKIIVTV
jgi:transcriptional regulator with XRE-family HTH domain